MKPQQSMKELLAWDSQDIVDAVGRAVYEAVKPHKQRGESIVVWEDGQAKTLTADACTRCRIRPRCDLASNLKGGWALDQATPANLWRRSRSRLDLLKSLSRTQSAGSTFFGNTALGLLQAW
jgi:hypothetical protein